MTGLLRRFSSPLPQHIFNLFNCSLAYSIHHQESFFYGHNKTFIKIPVLFKSMPKKIILYIASTLDGFIAKKNFSVDFLSEFENSGEDYGYNKFYDSIGTIVIMKHDLIDEFIISIVPVILGGGISLFKDRNTERKLRLVDVKKFKSGIVQVSYVRC